MKRRFTGRLRLNQLLPSPRAIKRSLRSPCEFLKVSKASQRLLKTVSFVQEGSQREQVLFIHDERQERPQQPLIRSELGTSANQTFLFQALRFPSSEETRLYQPPQSQHPTNQTQVRRCGARTVQTRSSPPLLAPRQASL
jgi:hypothetical protein